MAIERQGRTTRGRALERLGKATGGPRRRAEIDRERGAKQEAGCAPEHADGDRRTPVVLVLYPAAHEPSRWAAPVVQQTRRSVLRWLRPDKDRGHTRHDMHRFIHSNAGGLGRNSPVVAAATSSATARTASILLHLERGDECLLGDIDLAELAH